MTLVEDDAETNPMIAQSHLAYVRCLDDKHAQYTRFIDALLVPRPSHAAFFRDLKGFRCLPTTIKALSLCDPNDPNVTKEQRKENYRDVTTKYLGSRFAHPWCRKAMAGAGNTKAGGWFGAEWAATGRQMSKEQMEQEEKLHKMLVPLWIAFRAKMFPGDNAVEEWWESHQREPPVQQGIDLAGSSTSNSASDTNGNKTQQYKELSMASGGSRSKNEGEFEDDEEINRQAATAATGILRIAAAAMLIDSMPRLQKWKLKRELKRQNR